MPELQHTIWLWLEGVFARRIAYFLLLKGLTPSVADLLEGKSMKKNLVLMPVYPEPPLRWRSLDPTNPPPPNATNPCMEIKDSVIGISRSLYESTSILEETFPEVAMSPHDIVNRGRMHDMLGQVNISGIDTNYRLRNTIPEHGIMMGLAADAQSQAAAENAESQERKGLMKLQDWARQNSDIETEWLTPGSTGPGLVDVALVSTIRFVELIWGIDILADEDLKPLALWYKRFKSLPFWKEFEEREGILPPMLAFGKTSRAAWVKEAAAGTPET